MRVGRGACAIAGWLPASVIQILQPDLVRCPRPPISRKERIERIEKHKERKAGPGSYVTVPGPPANLEPTECHNLMRRPSGVPDRTKPSYLSHPLLFALQSVTVLHFWQDFRTSILQRCAAAPAQRGDRRVRRSRTCVTFPLRWLRLCRAAFFAAKRLSRLCG